MTLVRFRELGCCASHPSEAICLDTAKSIYHNATIEKVALLRHLAAGEKRSEINLQRFDHALEVRPIDVCLYEHYENSQSGIQDMRQVVEEMHVSSVAIENKSHDIFRRLQGGLDNVSLCRTFCLMIHLTRLIDAPQLC